MSFAVGSFFSFSSTPNSFDADHNSMIDQFGFDFEKRPGLNPGSKFAKLSSWLEWQVQGHGKSCLLLCSPTSLTWLVFPFMGADLTGVPSEKMLLKYQEWTLTLSVGVCPSGSTPLLDSSPLEIRQKSCLSE
jgi:hypothetical protein